MTRCLDTRSPTCESVVFHGMCSVVLRLSVLGAFHSSLPRWGSVASAGVLGTDSCCVWESKIVVNYGNLIMLYCEQAYHHETLCSRFDSAVLLARLPGAVARFALATLSDRTGCILLVFPAPPVSSPSSLLPPPSSLFSPLSSLVPPPSSVFGSGLDGSECNGVRLEGLERFFMVLDLTGRDRGGGVVLTKKYGKKL